MEKNKFIFFFPPPPIQIITVCCLILWNVFLQISLQPGVAATWGFHIVRELRLAMILTRWRLLLGANEVHALYVCCWSSSFRAICKKPLHKIMQRTVRSLYGDMESC